MELDLQNLGLAQRVESALSSEHAQQVAGLLDQPSPGAGEPLPLLWHWAFFNHAIPTADLGEDGHPRRNHPLLVQFPRRMWIGGSVTTTAALLLDRPAVRTSRILREARKSGSTGEFLLVTLEHRVSQAGKEVLREVQDVVYRRADAATPPVEVSERGDLSFDELVVPTSSLLFRFSAVTCNSHRIHYDEPYATQVEGYPALVVQGPLTAILLARAGSRSFPERGKRFKFTARAPLFVDQAFGITTTGVGSDRTSSVSICATRRDGVRAMVAELSR